MAESVSEITENVDNNASLETTAALTTSLIPPKQFFYAEVLSTLYLTVSVIGILANGVVLAVLILAHREHGSSVNILIAHQSAIDLFTCVSIVLTRVMILSVGIAYRGNQLVDNIVCILGGSGLFASMGGSAEKLGLMVITLERYFKIVHAIAHRKYFKKWMTKVGVALPWIGAVCIKVFPAMGTTRVLNGRCLAAAVWPNVHMAKVKYYCNTTYYTSSRHFSCAN